MLPAFCMSFSVELLDLTCVSVCQRGPQMILSSWFQAKLREDSRQKRIQKQGGESNVTCLEHRCIHSLNAVPSVDLADSAPAMVSTLGRCKHHAAASVSSSTQHMLEETEAGNSGEASNRMPKFLGRQSELCQKPKKTFTASHCEHPSSIISD